MKRALALCATAILLTATVAATAPRHLLVPPAGSDVGAFVQRHSIQVLEQYPNAVWTAGPVAGLEKQGVLVKTFADWDLIRTVEPFRTSERESIAAAAEPGLYLVHYRAPLTSEWAAALASAPGVTVVQSFPNLAMVVHVADAPFRFADLPGVDWAGPLDPAWRVSPHVAAAPAEMSGSALLMLANAPGLDRTLDALRSLGASFEPPAPRAAPWIPIRATGPRAAVEAAAALEHVLWIEPAPEMRLHDERQGIAVAGQRAGWVPDGPGYVAWLASVGLGQLDTVIVDVADDGWDTGDPTPGSHHPDFDDDLGSSRVIYQHNTCADGDHGVGGHGTINQAIVMGDGTGTGLADGAGYLYGTGVAPTARGGHSKVFSDAGTFCPSTMLEITAPAEASGAHITSNSWGATTYGAYNANAAEYDLLVRDANANPGDGLQEFTVVFSAGNDGPSAGQVGAPGTAKNVITSGASENVRDHNQLDGCGDSNADSFQDLTDFTSPGPAEDGRIKPDAIAPGNHIQGAASQYAGFNGSSVCGGPNNDFGGDPTDAYWPTAQTWYTWSSGTSHSAPGMAGMAALIFEWHLSAFGAPPSPAMNKAIMLASADDMAGGADGNGGTVAALPNTRQGWGLVNMGRITDGAEMWASDQQHLFTSSGQDHVPAPVFSTVDPARPLRVMLVWSDPPGDPNATPSGGLVNDLDLEVTVGADTYYGNRFSGGVSVPGGPTDSTNNVEAVYLPAGTATTFGVRVVASSLSGDGVPGNGTPADQDFALFMYNATDQSSAGIVSLVDEVVSCSSVVEIRVSDRDLQGAGSQLVTISSDSEPTPEPVDLFEDPPGSGIFAGSIGLWTGGPANGDGLLSVSDADTVTVEYDDADVGDGSPATVSDTADVDCLGPFITAVEVPAATLTDSTAVVTWTTDEPSTTVVEFGPAAPPSILVTTPGLTTDHSVELTGLDECASYVYQVTSCDALGNCSTDNNSGVLFKFTSGARDLFFADDVEAGAAGWTADPPWAITDTDASSPTHSWTDSPAGSYLNNTVAALTSPVIDLSAAPNAELRFDHRYDIELDDDFGRVQVTTNGTTWQTVATFTGVQALWVPEVVDLSAFAGAATLQVRFQLSSDTATTADGWFVDDIEVSAYRSCSAGRLDLDQQVYVCDETIALAVTDLDLNGDPGLQETVAVTVASDSEPGGETVILAEDGTDSALFLGAVDTVAAATPGDGDLATAHGDTVTATYADADDGTGAVVDVVANAVVDCNPPVISGIAVSDLGSTHARVEWTTDEPADSSVSWQTTAPPGSDTVSDSELLTAHAIELAGLAPCTEHTFQVGSTDAQGLAALSGDGLFETTGQTLLDLGSTDTPRGIPDANPSGVLSTVQVSDTDPVVDVDVAIDISHPWDTDLDISLIGPGGTVVDLSSDNGSSGDNYTGTVFDDEASTAITDGAPPFTGSFRPEQPLSVFDGTSPVGDWSLKVVDDGSGDVGTLLSWSLHLELDSPCGSGPDLPFADGFESGDTSAWSATSP